MLNSVPRIVVRGAEVQDVINGGPEQIADVTITVGEHERGKVEIAFYSSDDLERVLDLILASRERI